MSEFDQLRFRVKDFKITLVYQDKEKITWRARSYFFTGLGDCSREYTGLGSTPQEAIQNLIDFAIEQEDPPRF